MKLFILVQIINTVAKIPKIVFLTPDWIYSSTRIMTVYSFFCLSSINLRTHLRYSPTPHTHTRTLQRKKFYWRLDTKCLTLYKSDTSSQYHREIALADILAVDPMVNPEVYPLNPPHVFEIVTTAMTYYVGADMTGALPKDLKPPDSVSRRSLLVNVLPPQLH